MLKSITKYSKKYHISFNDLRCVLWYVLEYFYVKALDVAE